MIPMGEVKVNIDQEAVKQFIEEELQKQIYQNLLLVDINRLAQITSMSPRFLESEFLHDPRVKIYERRKVRKRFWIYEGTIKAILEIMNEW